MSASTSGGRSLSACVRARRSAVAAVSAGGPAPATTRAGAAGAAADRRAGGRADRQPRRRRGPGAPRPARLSAPDRHRRAPHRKGHRYLTVVVDHDSGLLVWAAPGRDRKTLRRFFDLLGEERCAKIELVSADGADWIAEVVNERCPNAALCLDPFPVVPWATAALH